MAPYQIRKAQRRVIALVKAGFTFRAIESKLTKTLGLNAPGNGTKALRFYRRALLDGGW